MTELSLTISIALLFCGSVLTAPSPQLLDLGFGFDENTQFWPGVQRFNFTEEIRSKNQNGIPWYAANTFVTAEHVGTHLDAPFHFDEKGWKVGEIPLERLFIKGVLIDVSEKVKNMNNFVLQKKDIIDWEKKHGPLPNEVVILIRFGWSQHYKNRTAYFGMQDNSTELNFPGISIEAAKYIVDSGKVFGVGVDTASLDPGQNPVFNAHQTLLGAKIYGLENLNLVKDSLPATGFLLTIMPMKVMTGTGAPTRVVALLNHRGHRL